MGERRKRGATGPVTKRGKEKSSRNSIKHGLNIATTPERHPLFHELAADLLDSGFSREQAVEAVYAILEYRRVMDVYRLSYFSVQDYKGVEYEMNLKSISILSDEDLGIEDANDRNLLTTLFSSMHKSEKKFGSLEGKRCDSVKNLIRYQRSAVSKLSKALARSL